jgi:hypothetical protein
MKAKIRYTAIFEKVVEIPDEWKRDYYGEGGDYECACEWLADHE